jgi:hypothetical protein
MRSKPNLISLCGIADDAIETDLSGLGVDADDAIVLASELPDKRHYRSLFSEAIRQIPVIRDMEPATLEVGMSEANFSKKNLGVGAIIIIAAWLTHKDNWALTRLDISKNQLFNHDGTARKSP